MKGIRFKVNFTVLFLLVLCVIDDVNARRFSSGGKSSKPSYHSSSSSTSNHRTTNYGNHGSSSGQTRTSYTGTSHTGTSHTGTSNTGSSYPGTSHTGTSHTGTSNTGSSYPGMSNTGSSYPRMSNTGSSYPGMSNTGSSYPGMSNTGSSYPGMSNTGSSYPGMSNTGSSYPGMSNTGSSYPGMSNTGSSYPGMSNTGSSYPGMSNTGSSYPGMSNTGSSYPGMSNTGTSYPRTPNTGSSYPGMSNTGLSYPGVSNTGTSYPGSSQTNTNHNQGKPQTSKNKDDSNTFLNVERTHDTSSPPRSPPQSSYTPGSTWSSNQKYVPRPGGRAGNSSSPYAPSAPPMHDVYKNSPGHPSHPTYRKANTTVSQPGPIGFNNDIGWKATQKPPISSVGKPHYSSQVPVGSSYSAGHVPVGNPYSPGHVPVGNPYSSGHIPVGNPYSPGHAPVGNSYPHGGGGAYGSNPYPQQQQYVSQPAYQPFVPGQTIMVIPQQQDSGRGLGQIFKEALVFSAVHATVNRLINPPHYHGSESKPQITENTYIIHNNQYITNGNNGSTNTMQENVPGGGNQGNLGVPYNSSTSYNPSGGMTGTPTSFGNGSENGNANGNGNGNGDRNRNTNGNGDRNRNTNGNAAGSNVNIPNQGNVTSNTQQPPANVPPIQYPISDDELFKITEQLFEKNTLNLLKYITLNLQNRSSSINITDDAKEPLFQVDPILYDYPTISVTRALYKYYEHDSRKPEDLNLEKYKEENLFLDIILDTNTMSIAMQWLVDHGFIYPDDFSKKELLQRLWFTVFQRSSCGFERAFMSENYAGVGLVGAQNWLYFSHEEFQKHINYMGYVDKVNVGSTVSLLKLNLQMAEVVRPNVTVFVGTLPELEMALYTICYYARPNNACPVSLGGTKFNIFTHSFSYFGTDVIDIVVPFF